VTLLTSYNVKINGYRVIILPVIYMGVKLGLSHEVKGIHSEYSQTER